MSQTYYELMRRQGISRRSFLKFCSLTAASLGLGAAQVLTRFRILNQVDKGHRIKRNSPGSLDGLV